MYTAKLNRPPILLIRKSYIKDNKVILKYNFLDKDNTINDSKITFEMFVGDNKDSIKTISLNNLEEKYIEINLDGIKESKIFFKMYADNYKVGFDEKGNESIINGVLIGTTPFIEV